MSSDSNFERVGGTDYSSYCYVSGNFCVTDFLLSQRRGMCLLSLPIQRCVMVRLSVFKCINAVETEQTSHVYYALLHRLEVIIWHVDKFNTLMWVG